MGDLITHCTRTLFIIQFSPRAHVDNKRLPRLLARSKSYYGVPVLIKLSPNHIKRVIGRARHSKPLMVMDPISLRTKQSSSGLELQKDNGTLEEEIGSVHATIDLSVACAGTQEQEEESNERVKSKKAQQSAYLFAALASSIGITSLVAGSVYYRFASQMQGAGEVPWTAMFGTFALALGAAVGMEFWARWTHRALWHASLWNMHESHHRHREGPFELNDVFAIINALPATSLMAYGFLHEGLVPGLFFGAGVEDVGGHTDLEKLLQKRKSERTNPISC